MGPCPVHVSSAAPRDHLPASMSEANGSASVAWMQTPARHHAGPLNRVPRFMGEQRPFRQTVRQVCAFCNSAWMARLGGAQSVPSAESSYPRVA